VTPAEREALRALVVRALGPRLVLQGRAAWCSVRAAGECISDELRARAMAADVLERVPGEDVLLVLG
jgi:hypothetical protein